MSISVSECATQKIKHAFSVLLVVFKIISPSMQHEKENRINENKKYIKHAVNKRNYVH